MSTKNQEGRKNKSVEKPEDWDMAIADAKEKIKSLQFSIEIFEQYKRENREWPVSCNKVTKAGADSLSAPA